MNVEQFKEFKRNNAKTFKQKVDCLIDEKYNIIERFSIVINKAKDPIKYTEFKNFVKECENKVRNNQF